MKRYNNLAFTVVCVLPIASIFFIILIVLGYFYSEQFLDFIVMCVVFTFLIILIWITIFALRDVWIITFYSKEKICQKNLWKSKEIKFDGIKEVYIAGSCLYLSSKNYNLTYRKKERFLGRKMKKALNNEIIILISKDVEFLQYIPFNEVKICILKNSLGNIIKKYIPLD